MQLKLLLFQVSQTPSNQVGNQEQVKMASINCGLGLSSDNPSSSSPFCTSVVRKCCDHAPSAHFLANQGRGSFNFRCTTRTSIISMNTRIDRNYVSQRKCENRGLWTCFNWLCVNIILCIFITYTTLYLLDRHSKQHLLPILEAY